ncbi:MAG: spermidine/putrescine ABC transporter permease [Chloroflexi bacterium]|nr:MAG: spermidine/putrescine ABC transporter permease [Chloroflexota bacterium]
MLYRHRWLQVLLLLAPPTGWFLVVYLGSLSVLFLSAFWLLDPLTSAVVHTFSLRNFQILLGDPTYRTIVLRTVGIAAAVTLTDALLAFPIAFYMARVAGPHARSLLFMAVLLPLWSSYLVRVYAWRVMLQPHGPVESFLSAIGLPNVEIGYSDVSMWIVFSYIWLPYMILPLYAGLERIPRSLLEASQDLGGRGGITLRRVILPLALPALAAGSIFTFALTLGDYITPTLISNSQFIGNVVYDSQGVANNIPFAAAFAIVPVVIMAGYLLIARRLGAFEAL